MKQRWSQACKIEPRNKGIKWENGLSEQGKTHEQTNSIIRMFIPKTLYVYIFIGAHANDESSLGVFFLLHSISS